MSFGLTPDQKEELEKEAKELGISVGKLVRKKLGLKIKGEKS